MNQRYLHLPGHPSLARPSRVPRERVRARLRSLNLRLAGVLRFSAPAGCA